MLNHRYLNTLTSTILVVLLALTGCREQPQVDAEIEAEAPFENGATPDELVGTWLLVEQGGQAPETLWSVTFTTMGDYIVVSETRAVDRKHFYLTGENMIALTDTLSGETDEFFEYRVSGDNLYLTVPGEEVTTVLERRDDLIEERPDLVPDITTDPHPDEVGHLYGDPVDDAAAPTRAE